MRRRKWTITTWASGKKREVELVVYGTLGILRREATRWAKRSTPGDTDFHDAAGVFHGFERIRVGNDGSETSHPLVGVIRLSVDPLNALVVSHEIAHAAQHLYDIDFLGYGNKDLARDDFGSDNENFAHLYGELFSAAWTTLTAAGLTETEEQHV